MPYCPDSIPMRPSIISGWRAKYSLISHWTIRRLNGSQLSPTFAGCRRLWRPLLEEQNIGGHFRSRIRLECGVGQPQRAQQDRSIRQMASNRGVLLVHGVAAGDQRDHASGPDHVKGLREEVVVYGAGQVRTSAICRIVDRIVAKRDVSDRCIKEVFGKRRVFEAPFA